MLTNIQAAMLQRGQPIWIRLSTGEVEQLYVKGVRPWKGKPVVEILLTRGRFKRGQYSVNLEGTEALYVEEPAC